MPSLRWSERLGIRSSGGASASSTAAIPPRCATLTTCFCETRHIVPRPFSVAANPITE